MGCFTRMIPNTRFELVGYWYLTGYALRSLKVWRGLSLLTSPSLLGFLRKIALEGIFWKQPVMMWPWNGMLQCFTFKWYAPITWFFRGIGVIVLLRWLVPSWSFGMICPKLIGLRRWVYAPDWYDFENDLPQIKNIMWLGHCWHPLDAKYRFVNQNVSFWKMTLTQCTCKFWNCFFGRIQMVVNDIFN